MRPTAGEELIVDISFEDKDTRIAFIQKVLSITLLEVLIVTRVMFHINKSSSLQNSIGYNYGHYVACSVLAYLVTLGLLIYCKDARWKKPYNYMFLVLYPMTSGCLIATLAHEYSIFDGISVAMHYFSTVMLALLMYSVFALHNKIEFTFRIGIYIALSLLIASLATTMPFFYLNDYITVLYPCLVVFLLTAYILFDLEVMVSRQYRFEVTPADFLMGALILHIDFRYVITKLFRLNPWEQHTASNL